MQKEKLEVEENLQKVINCPHETLDFCLSLSVLQSTFV